jgi:hypothetical protein
MSFPVKSTDAAAAVEEVDYADESFPVNPYYASANRAFLVATDEEEGGHDMDVPSNSRTVISSNNMILPIAIPISAGCHLSSTEQDYRRTSEGSGRVGLAAATTTRWWW